MQKKCFKCGRELPLEDFYPHPRMADGHLNKCRECTRSDVLHNRRSRVEYYRDYDRQRNTLPERNARLTDDAQRRRIEEPEKYLARTAAGNALRDGRIRKEPCYFCGSTTDCEMHHPDYSKPLRVYWLCRICHRKMDSMEKLGVEVTSDTP